MNFEVLALVAALGLVGPLLALPTRLRLPVVLGELLAGVLIGRSGFQIFDTSDVTATFLADIGFALVMFVAGTHVPIRDPHLMAGIKVGAGRAVAVGVVATGIAWIVTTVFDTGNLGLYAVLMASSSAAIIMPVVNSESLSGPAVLQMLPQIAIADAACIVALPLVIDPSRAVRAAVGSAVVIACAIALFLVLRYLEASGVRRRVHRLSERRQFALELRINLAILFGLAAVAVFTHVSIMLAGFSFGLAIAAIGPPRRLTKQMFAITEGFLGPVYFVWLGASLDLRDLGSHPAMIGLGIALGLGAVVAHVAMRVTRQPLTVGMLAAAQLGVPVSAVTLGTQSNLFAPGEAPAILLGALVTLAATTVAGSRLARNPAQ
ncbi:cation:proton antiporter [Actinomycetes bacterium M1A6_2h]